jgi:hypothetical protein
MPEPSSIGDRLLALLVHVRIGCDKIVFGYASGYDSNVISNAKPFIVTYAMKTSTEFVDRYAE